MRSTKRVLVGKPARKVWIAGEWILEKWDLKC
jgi:hypothetical protein